MLWIWRPCTKPSKNYSGLNTLSGISRNIKYPIMSGFANQVTYKQVPLAEESTKCVINMHPDFFHYYKMLFGVSSAPGVFGMWWKTF